MSRGANKWQWNTAKAEKDADKEHHDWMLGEVAKREAGGDQAPVECTQCGTGFPRFRGALTCLECARRSCKENSEEGWDTTSKADPVSKNAYAFAFKTECRRERPVPGGRHGCESCLDTMWISHDRVTEGGTRYPSTERCPGQDLARRLDLFNRAELPGKHHACSFDTFKPHGKPEHKAAQAAHLQWAKRWAHEINPRMPERRGILLGGRHGLGKTHILVAVARHLTTVRGIPVRYLDWGDLVSKLGSSVANSGDGEEVLRPYLETPVLLLDELGTGRATDYRREQLERLIDRRYRNPMVITCAATNYDTKDLQGKLHDRIMSRLKEKCDSRVLVGEDYRGRR